MIESRAFNTSALRGGSSDYGEENEAAFSWVSLGITDARAVATEGVGFATMAKSATDDPVWDEVLALLHALLAAVPPASKTPHFRLVHSAG